MAAVRHYQLIVECLGHTHTHEEYLAGFIVAQSWIGIDGMRSGA